MFVDDLFAYLRVNCGMAIEVKISKIEKFIKYLRHK